MPDFWYGIHNDRWQYYYCDDGPRGFQGFFIFYISFMCWIKLANGTVGFQGDFNLASMMPSDATFSDSYTFDGCSFSSLGILIILCRRIKEAKEAVDKVEKISGLQSRLGRICVRARSKTAIQICWFLRFCIVFSSIVLHFFSHTKPRGP